MSEIERYKAVQPEHLEWGDLLHQPDSGGRWMKFNAHDLRIANIKFAFEKFVAKEISVEEVFATIDGKTTWPTWG